MKSTNFGVSANPICRHAFAVMLVGLGPPGTHQHRKLGSRNATPSPRPRSRNHTLANSAPPAVNIRTYDMLTPQERMFLEAADQGNLPKLQRCLEEKSILPLNVNALDTMGRTALEIAVDNENIEMVAVLLQQENIRIGNALLCAIREGVYRLVEMLVNHPSISKETLGEGWSQYLDPQETATAEYSSDISPIILACHLNQFEILQMLLRKDARIEKPHKHSCICELCDKERLNDSLHHSLKRINTYRALASPAWMSLTSSDPILAAFKLSWELQNLAVLEHEFKETFLGLSEQCKQYACDLLSQCRSTEEVIAVLNKEQNSNDENIDVWASKLSLSRLKLAIKYEQKMFVSHPHCQQLLTSIWYEGFPGRLQRGSRWNVLICLLLILLWPVFALSYVVLPKSRIGRIVRSPFMKFLYYSISFGCFLVLLTLATFESYRDDRNDNRASDRGPPPSFIETLVFFWVLGMLWSEMKQLWEEGFIKYIYQWWNWLDFIMMCLYLCTIAMRASAYFIFASDYFAKHRYHQRYDWDAYEPMLVAEALFAVGNIFSFSRIIYLFQTNPYLGPLQISLGCMLIDVAKFCFIFILIITSFAIGLAQLYWYYDFVPDCVGEVCRTDANAFNSITNSYMTLLWSLFSITKVEDTDVMEDHYFTQWVGRGMFIMYHMVSIIVLLNMLIAMMSHSFQIINDHADLEWKFHRTKLWMTHFDEGSSLPPPFNIIITPKAVFYAVCAVYNTCRWVFGHYQYTKNRNRATIRRPGYSRKRNEREKSQPGTDEENQDLSKPLTYMDIIQRLVSRYIHQTKKCMKMDGVNEDDLLEIKQDISSLRYELRDDRQKEIVRSSSHIDAVKRDIMRTMSTNNRVWPRRMSKPRNSVAEEADMMDMEDDDSVYVNPSNDVSPSLSNFFIPTIESDDKPKIFRKPTLKKTPPTPMSAPPGLNPQGVDWVPLEAIQRLRDDMNQRLDQLIAQITSTGSDYVEAGSMRTRRLRSTGGKVNFVDETNK
ncbi:hypothetical protein QR680_013981 [Steinernema hermaphroditum]|uniref:Transient receptor ion channel domain-containing protein n=1 Tax=Steinernema hermaphroditum TaxID=289476 RepID=A0AA39M3F2_9BILA|nr:hypothetical protein QR680_013981 [Steinernema hermaphroditum]